MSMYVWAFVIAFIVTYCVTPIVRHLAIRWGAMDAPDARKVHHGVIPRLGGLAIFIGYIAALLITIELKSEIIGLVMGSIV